ncbi:MAG: choice-of-anchor D domain-containing protein [Candidatus Acidiferrales bacterium]
MKKALHHLLMMGVTFCSAGILESANGAEPMVTLSSTAVNFTEQSAGTASAPQKIALTNSGAAPLIIAEVAITGENKGDFFQTNNCPVTPATLVAGASCVIDVTFQPSTPGALTAILTISDNASGSPQSVQLRGDATPPVPILAVSPTNLIFGNQAVGSTSSPRTVVLTNTGSVALNITTTIAITGNNAAEFILVPSKTTCPAGAGQLPAKASCAIGVTFAPTTLGAKGAQVTIADDAAGSPHAVPLAGVGTAPPTRSE